MFPNVILMDKIAAKIQLLIIFANNASVLILDVKEPLVSNYIDTYRVDHYSLD